MSEKLEQAIHEVELGNKPEALRLIAQVLKDDPKNEDAWIWMAEAVDDSIKKVECLEKVLEINPFNQDALRGLEHLRGEAGFMRSDPFPFKTDDDPGTGYSTGGYDPFAPDDSLAPEWSFGGERVTGAGGRAEWEPEPAPVQIEPPAAEDEPGGEEEFEFSNEEEFEPAEDEPAGGIETEDEAFAADAPEDIRALMQTDTPQYQPGKRKARKPALLTKNQFLILAVMALVVLLVVAAGGGWILYTILVR